MLNIKISQNKTKLWYGALIVSPLKEEEKHSSLWLQITFGMKNKLTGWDTWGH